MFTRSLAGGLLLALILALLADRADAGQQTARHPSGDSVTVTDEPCALAGVLALVHPSLHADLRAGSAVVSGTRFDLCWRDIGGGVHLFYEDGDQGVVPWKEFGADKRGT